MSYRIIIWCLLGDCVCQYGCERTDVAWSSSPPLLMGLTGTAVSAPPIDWLQKVVQHSYRAQMSKGPILYCTCPYCYQSRLPTPNTNYMIIFLTILSVNSEGFWCTLSASFIVSPEFNDMWLSLWVIQWLIYTANICATLSLVLLRIRIKLMMNSYSLGFISYVLHFIYVQYNIMLS